MKTGVLVTSATEVSSKTIIVKIVTIFLCCFGAWWCVGSWVALRKRVMCQWLPG